MRPLIPAAERFQSKTKAMPSGCVEWMAQRTEKGYGRFRYGERTIKAHRMAWLLAHGEDSIGGLSVLHKCDNPPCVNISHLFLGNHIDNMKDRTAKGRDMVGIEAPMAKLDGESVKKIRALYDAGGHTHKSLAAMFGIHPSAVYLLRHRKTWAHI